MLLPIRAFFMTTGPMKRLFLSYDTGVMPFLWSWCQYSVLATRRQKTLNRELSLCLCITLLVISQLRQRISLHSLIMLLTPPLWCVHFYSSSYYAQGKSINNNLFLNYSTHTFLCLLKCLIYFSYLQFTLNCPINEGISIY